MSEKSRCVSAIEDAAIQVSLFLSFDLQYRMWEFQGPHPCPELCHPGPCPRCTAAIRQADISEVATFMGVVLKHNSHVIW